MDCREFNRQVQDLADDRLMDAMVRRSALAHAVACRACSALLGAERGVAEDLRIYAEATETASAPPRLKQTLRAAFDAQHSSASSASSASGILDFPSGDSIPSRRLWARSTLAAAAGLIALLAVGAIVATRRDSPVDPRSEMARAGAVDSTPRPAPSASPSPSSSPSGPSKAPSTTTAPAHKRPRAQLASARSTASRQSVGDAEETTAFIPLTYMGGGAATDGGLIVRVEVPRTTLLSLGLPLNLERQTSVVKADLLVGDDGIARAIRLVE
jgi:hypothetical protein